MVRVDRSRRLLLTVGLAASLGCHDGTLSAVGSSPPRAAERSALPDAGEMREESPVPSDFRRRMAKMSDRFLSHGHGERFDVVVWANTPFDAGTDAGAREGSVLVEEVIDHDMHGDRPAGFLVMEKLGASWRFETVDPGGLVTHSERSGPCASCHAEAADGLFPWKTMMPPP